MIDKNYEIIEHPRILFFLGFFCFCIGISCGISGNYLQGIEFAILLPLTILVFGGWKRISIIVLVILISMIGWYIGRQETIEREYKYRILQEETNNFSGSYTIRGKVEKMLYNSNLSSTYRLNIANIANRSTENKKIVDTMNIGIFMEIPNNLHINIGDTIEYTGKIIKVIDFPLKGFSRYAWYNKIYGKSIVPIFKRINIVPITPLGEIQLWAKSLLFAGFPENIAGIILGMTLGNIELLTNETKKYFTNTGITHILVVSGSNIAFVIIIITGILKYFPVHRIVGSIIVIVFVISYGSLVGWDMPVIRAVAMGLIVYIAMEGGKKISSISILMLVGWGILIYSPLALIYDAGFGLSFTGTLGILVFHEPLRSLLSNRNIPSFFSDIINVTLAASAGSMVAIIYHFSTIPVFSILSNILISGFLGWILFASVLYLLFALIGGWVLYIWGWTIYIPTAYIMWISELFGNGYILRIDEKISEPLALFMIGILISVLFYLEKQKLLQSK